MVSRAGKRKRLVRIERPVADSTLNGAGSGDWALFKEVYAEILDLVPSRRDRAADGFNVGVRPARVRIRYRTDVTPDMRFVLGPRIMQIVDGPAVIEDTCEVEFMVEDYRPAGNTA